MTDSRSAPRDKTAVLIMDYQLRQLNGLSEGVRAGLLTRANEVLAWARAAGVPVIHVEVRRGEAAPETEIHPDVRPRAGEMVLTKRRIEPFSTTNLAEVLDSRGVRTLVLMGVSTSGVVISSACWAADVDYDLVVLSDCCADRDEEVHRVLTEKVLTRRATVLTAGEFLASVQGAAS